MNATDGTALYPALLGFLARSDIILQYSTGSKLNSFTFVLSAYSPCVTEPSRFLHIPIG